MSDRSPWQREVWIPLLAGVLWLALGTRDGLFATLLAVGPGALMVA